jgi:hypothetical protein
MTKSVTTYAARGGPADELRDYQKAFPPAADSNFRQTARRR